MRDDPSGQSQRDAWAYLQGLGVDVALVQEAVPPPFLDPATWNVRSHPAPDQPDAWFIHPRYRRWGSAVVVVNPALEFEPIESTPLGRDQYRRGLWISHPGTWAGIKLLPADAPPITLVSAYGMWDGYNPETKAGYYPTVLNRMLSDLTPLIDSEAGKRMVLAGDLNIGSQFTESTQGSERWGPMSRATLDRIAAFGFVDCLAVRVPLDRGPLTGCACGPLPDCRHVRTLRYDNNADSQPWQNDLVFASAALAAGLVACAPVDDEEAWALSDHCPIVAEFEV
jgi:hypothetical protein